MVQTAESAAGRVTRPVVLGFPQVEHLSKTVYSLSGITYSLSPIP
jgi:hypothetical protein